jgi:PII-like signaling protein
MITEGKAQVLRIYIGSSDKLKHTPMYESIVMEAKRFGIAGASVFRGILSYGAHSQLHSAKIWALSTDLPLIIEIVDEKEKILAFIDHLSEWFEATNFGGMITTYEVEILKYQGHQNK